MPNFCFDEKSIQSIQINLNLNTHYWKLLVVAPDFVHGVTPFTNNQVIKLLLTSLTAERFFFSNEQ